MSIRNQNHSFAGQNLSLTKAAKLRGKAVRWADQARQRGQQWVAKRAARLERYRDAFRSSWLTKVGLGLMAIWNFITNPPFEITRSRAPLAPMMMMTLPFTLRRKDRKDKKPKKARKPRFASSQSGQLHAEALEARQLLAASIIDIDLNPAPASDSGIVGDMKTNVASPSFDVQYNNFSPLNSIVLLDSTGAITGSAGTIIGSSAALPLGMGTTTIMMTVPFPADGTFDVEADSALV